MNSEMSTQSEIKSNFNDENAWDDRQNLFDLYFLETIENNKHYVVYLETRETYFDKAVSDLKTKYKRVLS